MASACWQLAASVVVLASVLTVVFGLPPFELRSQNIKSEGSQEWLNHLKETAAAKRTDACHAYTKDHPTFYCSSAKYGHGPACVRDTQLCDGTPDCHQGEDESPVLCAALRVVMSKEENDLWSS